MEPEDSLPYPLEPVTSSYPEVEHEASSNLTPEDSDDVFLRNVT
jgi:hypothetical protein